MESAGRANGRIAVGTTDARELGLAEEGSLYLAGNLKFVSFPIPDRGVPNSFVEFADLDAEIEQRLRSGESIAVHRRTGIGRSGLLGACILNAFGVDPSSALGMLSRAAAHAASPYRIQTLTSHGFVKMRGPTLDPIRSAP
jgi:protein-tyrosine phosphatase